MEKNKKTDISTVIKIYLYYNKISDMDPIPYHSTMYDQ